MPKLKKAYPNWYDYTLGGIFHDIKVAHGSEFEWLDGLTDVLDIEYYGNHSGDKTISPLLDKMIEDNIEAQELNPESLTSQQRAILANICYKKFGMKWAKLYAITQAEYNPIENYSMTQTETPNISRKNLVSDDYALTDERKTGTNISRTETPSNDFSEVEEKTIARNTTRTETPSDDYEITDEKKTKTDITVDTDTDTANDVYGFNSTIAVPVNKANAGSTVTTTGEANDNVETSTHTQTGGITVTETADEDENKETTTHTRAGSVTVTESGSQNDNIETHERTQTGYTEETETGTRTLTRSGNIGVTTSQQMIESEIELWKWNFFDNVFSDIDTILTCSIYE